MANTFKKLREAERARRRNPRPQAPSKAITVDYRPHKNQYPIHVDKHRYRVVCAGRRFGKSVLARQEIMRKALTWTPGKKVRESGIKHVPRFWIVSPCYDPKTEVLTNEGWKFFSDLNKKEKVATLVDGKMAFESPSEYFAEPYEGEMIGAKNNGVDILVTPNHRCLSRGENKHGWEIKRADEIYGKWRRFNRSAKWSGSKVSNSKKRTKDWFELMGFWFADGCARVREHSNGSSGEVCLSQKKKIDYVEDLLKRNNLSFTKSDKGGKNYNYYIYPNTKHPTHTRNGWVHHWKLRIATELVSYGDVRTKKIPRWILDASPFLIEKFLYGYWMGDGHFANNNYDTSRALTVSKDLADGIQEMIIKVGGSANIAYDVNRLCYMVTRLFKKKFNTPVIKPSSWYKQQYKGMIYCVKVKSGIIMVRRNGRHYWCGNTYRQGREIHWEELKAEIPQGLIASKNETNLEISLINGPIIELKGSENESALRGAGLVGVVLDECAYMKEHVWPRIIEPMLLETKGWALFISCVVQDTLILGEGGIEEIGTCSLGYTDEVKRFYGLGGFHKTTHRYGGGECPTRKIKTNFGFEIECTPNHKLWTLGGWKRADEFREGDQVLLQYGQGVFGDNIDISDFKYLKRKSHNDRDIILNEDFAYLMGLVLSEGNWTDTCVDITNGDEEIADFLVNKSGFPFRRQKRGGKLSPLHFRCSSSKLAAFIDYLGIPHGAKNKIIPEKVFRWPKELIKAFLQGYFDGDGCADTRGNRHRVSCSSASVKLIKQLQVLLLNFGILAKRRKYITPPTKIVKVSSVGYRLSIEGYGAAVFFKEIGFRLARKQQQQFEMKKNRYFTAFNWDDWDFLNSNFRHLKTAKKIQIYTLKRFLRIKRNSKYSTDMICDTVGSVVNSESSVYDFVIPETHSFFTNGFVSHNTPYGPNWFKQIYQKGIENSSNYEPEWKSWHFTSYDNPYVDSEELEKKKAQLVHEEFEQEYMANFVVFQNLIYKEFKFETNVIKPFDMEDFPEGTSFYRAMDFGFRHATACLWIAVTPEEDWYVIDEFYSKETSTEHNVGVIKSMLPKLKVEATYGDPSATQIMEDCERLGLYVSAAERSHKTTFTNWVKFGIGKISDKLRMLPDCDGKKKPKLFVFNNCIHTIEEFQKYRWKRQVDDEKQESSMPLKRNDDCVDALRYFAVSFSEPMGRADDYNFPKEQLFKKGGFYI